MSEPHVVVLGAGPAGVGAALQLARRRRVRVTVLERNERVGGNAGSFDLAGFRVDYGSHRLHPSCDPRILSDIRSLLGDDLLDRPRHGRIRLRNRWVHFPLAPLDLALKLPPSFAIGVASDLVAKLVPRNHRPGAETFASILEAGLGRTICREFYFPYARKIWGGAPEELAVTQARRRVSASSLGKMASKVLAAVPGLKPPGAGRFYYPRRGYGQISEAMYRAAEAAGAQFQFGATVQALERDERRVSQVTYEHNGALRTVDADHVWSTVPITALARALQPAAPAEIIQAAGSIHYRAMILIYLVLEQDCFSEYDAHYFPDRDIPITRLSEPKNYSHSGPSGQTVLCAELPCATTDAEWHLSDDALADLVRAALARAGIPVRAAIREVATRRLRQAYPIYRQGYDVHFDRIDRYLDGLSNLLTFGRQGLFAHDNTHHALAMAYAASDCLSADGRFDHERWQGFRRLFETHVVED